MDVPDLSILTVWPWVTWFHCLFHGLTVSFSFFSVFQNLSGFFSQNTHTFLKKQTQVSHSIAAEEIIPSMINNNKTSSRSSLFLSWALLLILLLQTLIVKPFQWKPPSDLLKRAKKENIEVLTQFSIQ